MIGHVLRQNRENDCNIALTCVPERKRKRGIRKKNMEKECGEKKRRVGVENMRGGATGGSR